MDALLRYYPSPRPGELGTFDLVASNGALAVTDQLETAVFLSVFTDARATDEELAAYGFSASERGGWWGDALTETQARYGSKLWLLGRAKQTTETLLRAKEYLDEALRWLVDEGVADSVMVTTEWVRMGFMAVSIAISSPSLPDGQYNFVWSQQNAA